jgi:hypothetical protein
MALQSTAAFYSIKAPLYFQPKALSQDVYQNHQCQNVGLAYPSYYCIFSFLSATKIPSLNP